MSGEAMSEELTDRIRAALNQNRIPRGSEPTARGVIYQVPLETIAGLVLDAIRPELAELDRLRAHLANVTDAMVARAWETFGWERRPYMARISNFTREQIDNGELRAADLQASAMNDSLMRATIAAAIAVAVGHDVEAERG